MYLTWEAASMEIEKTGLFGKNVIGTKCSWNYDYNLFIFYKEPDGMFSTYSYFYIQ